jgi:predicted  nucleic acid-binding Zn-ribbon protein
MENKSINDPKSVNENVVVTNKVNTARKEGVTKGALTTGIISLILLLGLGVLAYSLHTRDHKNQLALMENQKVSFTAQLTERDSTLNDWLASFDEIERNLQTIKEKENIITVKSSGAEVSKDRRNQILADIKNINSLIDENKKKIAQLNAQLKKSGNTISGLQTRIAALEESMKTYENEIAELKTNLVKKDFEIGQLNDRVFALNDTLTIKKETINNQTYKLNQAFLISGTFKDLKEKGLLSKEGGFLGIGRKENLLEDFSDSLFKEIDITKIKTIPVNSKNARLVTEHPSGSYELIKENENQVAYIAIKDPEEFWKISKYAVVEIIK